MFMLFVHPVFFFSRDETPIFSDGLKMPTTSGCRPFMLSFELIHKRRGFQERCEELANRTSMSENNGKHWPGPSVS